MSLFRAGSAAVGALLLVAGLVGCSSGTGTREPSGAPAPKTPAGVDQSKLTKELNVFNWTEYLPEDVLKEFQSRYGVKVNYDTYSSNEEMHAKLKAGASGYDVVFPSDYMMQVLRREQLLEQMDPGSISNLTNIEARFLGKAFDPKNEFSVPYMWGTTGIAVNSEKVNPDTIKSYKDLWRPDFKGALVLPDDARETLGLALRSNGQSANTSDPGQLDQAKQRLIALKPNIKAFNSDSPKDLLLSGEVAAGVMWSGEAAKAIQENPKIRYVIPVEGTTIWMDSMAIPKGAPHKYTAEVFINFLLEPEISVRLSKAYPYGIPNQGAQKLLPEEYRTNPAINPPAQALDKAEWMQDLGDDANQLFDKVWTELKSS
jgi:spermidine/putrescine-binding protein